MPETMPELNDADWLERIEAPGRRPAVGVVAPFDMELDAELWRWLPRGVDLLMTRTPYVEGEVTIEFAREVSGFADIEIGVRSVTAGRVDTVAYACTSGSFVGGRSGEAVLAAAMRAAGAAEAVTTSGAVVEAFSALGIDRVSVATPYLPELSALLENVLGEHGVGVAGHLAMGRGSDIWAISYREVVELARAADRPDAQAILLSCTNLPTYDIIVPLERELGKPVVSANQATMWAALRRMGLAAHGPGQTLLGVV